MMEASRRTKRVARKPVLYVSQVAAMAASLTPNKQAFDSDVTTASASHAVHCHQMSHRPDPLQFRQNGPGSLYGLLHEPQLL
jgi:acyl-CoA thioesterase